MPALTAYLEGARRVAALAREGSVDEAIKAAAALSQAYPTRPEPWLQWAALLCAAGRAGEAEAPLQQCIALQPDNGPALSLLGEVLFGAGRFGEARDALEKAIKARSTDGQAWLLLGRTLAELDLPRAAIDAIARTIELAPRNAAAIDLMGRLQAGLGEWSRSAQLFRRAWEISGSGESGARLGDALLQIGEAEEAASAYRAASSVLTGKSAAAAASQALFAGQFLRRHPGRRLAEHQEWAKRFGQPPTPRHVTADPRPDRPLRVAFLSPRFRTASLSFLLLPLIESIRGGEVQACLYAEQDEGQDDALTTKFRERASLWRRTVAMNDATLAERMRDDQIDIAIDLAGHTPGNRLGALSARCAPITLSWLDYCDTTGCSGLDAVMTDGFHSPVGGVQRFVERLIRLNPLRFCYQPPRDAPEAKPRATRPVGHVVFGAFHRRAKLNAELVRLWGELLAQLPAATLQIRCDALASADERRLYRSELEARGLPVDRVQLQGPLAHQALLDAYAEVDICLDSHPYNGGITTLEALFMGRPVVTLCGDTMISRQSAAILTAAGLGRLVASTPQDYLAIAVRLASDVPSRAMFGGGLREQLLSSPVCDSSGFARRFERALRDAWHQHCRGEPVGESS